MFISNTINNPKAGTVEFVIRAPDAKDYVLKIKLSADETSNDIKLNIADLLRRQAHLGKLLAKFIKSKGSVDDLKNLATEGYYIFNSIDSQIDPEDITFKTLWEKGFLNKFNNRSRAKIVTEGKDKQNLVVAFPKGVSFPFGLLFMKNPMSIDWKKVTVNDVLPHFFDLMFNIRNIFNPDGFSKGLTASKGPIKSGTKSNLYVVHAINKDFHTPPEEECWKYDSDIVLRKASTVDKLLKAWHDQNNPGIIHFSTHYTTEPQPYKLILADDEEYFKDKHEAYLIHNKKKPPVKPAFVFLNTCSSGIVSDPDFADILSDLYPAYALGIIATTFNIMDVHAGELPRAFYDNFIRQNKTAFDSFTTAKNWLILGEKKYSAFGYLLWFAHPDLRYSLKPLAIVKKTLRKTKRKLTTAEKKLKASEIKKAS